MTKPYSQEIREQAVRMRESGMYLKDISKALGPAPRTITDWFLGYGARVYNDAADHVRVPPQVLEDRERRYAMPMRDLTAALQGDPPVGRSALEMRAAKGSLG